MNVVVRNPPAEFGLKGAHEFLEDIWNGLGGDRAGIQNIDISGDGELPHVFPVTDFAAASIAAASSALAEFIAARHCVRRKVSVDRRLSSFWFGLSVRPDGWEYPALWDSIAGDYQAADGWIRLHTNASHHRKITLSVLDIAPEKEAAVRAVARWTVDALESAIVERGACAAAMRSREDWLAHPQGRAIAGEPLVWRQTTAAQRTPAWPVLPERPLAGIKVLDLTRFLAGPVATRFLAGYGARVLRIDPPDWDESTLEPEVMVGKQSARLDLRTKRGGEVFKDLLRQADVLVHGYRSDALARLGIDSAHRREISAGLVDVGLNAYGWSGPWSGRRGFDSIVQMSSGIACAGMRGLGSDRPKPMPVQALDQATGYLMAAAAIRGLTQRLTAGVGTEARVSLARTGHLLASHPRLALEPAFAAEGPEDVSSEIEETAWGRARRLRPPMTIDGVAMRFDRTAARLGAGAAAW